MRVDVNLLRECVKAEVDSALSRMKADGGLSIMAMAFRKRLAEELWSRLEVSVKPPRKPIRCEDCDLLRGGDMHEHS